MIIMGVDLGHARTGLSLCDELEMLASPLCVVEERSPKLLLQKVADAAKGHRAQLIVVGCRAIWTEARVKAHSMQGTLRKS